jgi:hypothetical protein
VSPAVLIEAVVFSTIAFFVLTLAPPLDTMSISCCEETFVFSQHAQKLDGLPHAPLLRVHGPGDVSLNGIAASDADLTALGDTLIVALPPQATLRELNHVLRRAKTVRRLELLVQKTPTLK